MISIEQPARKLCDCALKYLHCQMIYRIVVNFQGRKPLWICRKWEFHRENLHRMLETNHRWVQHVPKFCGEKILQWPSNLERSSPLKVFHYTVCSFELLWWRPLRIRMHGCGHFHTDILAYLRFNHILSCCFCNRRMTLKTRVYLYIKKACSAHNMRIHSQVYA